LSRGQSSAVDLRLIKEKELSLLENLLQLYLYEIGLEPEDDGKIDYGESIREFITSPRHFASFIDCRHKHVGFALAKLNRKARGEDGKSNIEAHLLSEFFIFRPHRRNGYGRKAFRMIVADMPGTWIITTWPRAVAVDFWRSVANEFERVREFTPDKHKGFPHQFVWQVET
jgi:predicted acetyltransferase